MKIVYPSLHILSISFLHLLFSFFIFPAFALTNQRDVNALIALRAAWSSNPSDWDTSTDPCDDVWLGVGCDSTNTQVVQLALINRQLNGNLPAAIGNLSALTDLDLSSNPNLGGLLPTTIGTLNNLTRFFVQFCNFSGSIPSEIGNLANLQYLGLTSNSFTGSLPDSIGLLTNVFYLDISNNFLSGGLPVSTSSTNGRGLDNLTNAHHFHLQNNSFSGTIPSAIFSSQMQLEHLLLNNNSFNGTIPSNIGDLPNVKIVRFDFNNLTGSVPSSISSMQNLTTLDLDNNALTGLLPDLSNNTNLHMLELGSNQYDASQVPAWITNLTNLQLLSLQSANLNGSIPSELFALPLLSNVSLGSNSLSGTLNLTEASSTLLIVDATNNDISAVDKGDYSQVLLLDGNTYCNSNPRDCTGDQLATSPVPSPPNAPAVSICTNKCAPEYAVNPKISGNCQCARPVLGNITFEATEIPILADYNISRMEQQYAIGLSQYLLLYNLTFNQIQVVVDIISNFQITVSVFPPSSVDLWRANDASRIAYALNRQFIGFEGIGPLNTEFGGSPYDTAGTIHSLSSGAIAGIVVAAAVCSIAIVVVTVYAVKQKRRAEKAEKQNKPFASWIAAANELSNPDIPRLKGARWFSLAEIRKYTNNFSRNSEIGEGGYGKVYKGYRTSGDGIAIKRAGANSLQGATEFKNEIELLSRVHHRNLVGLVGFCFEENEQMLVYEYVPNGTLRDCLSGLSDIDMIWERRIAIALGSARGIAYLHAEANPPIIHRDIKSSNILLDKNLVPKVADFGLSTLVRVGDGDDPESTDVKGTLGYLDPDYFMTSRLTEKSDVYSFGVVILELITNRLPIQEGKYLVPEVSRTFKQGGMKAVLESMVDPELTNYPKEDMEKLVELSLWCVDERPEVRPVMAEVVKGLESLMQKSSVVMDMPVGDAREELYAQGAPFTNPFPSSSFEYTGSFVGKPGPVRKRSRGRNSLASP